MVSQFGIPVQLTLNNGTQFKSHKTSKKLSKSYLLTIVCHQSSNGQAERYV